MQVHFSKRVGQGIIANDCLIERPVWYLQEIVDAKVRGSDYKTYKYKLSKIREAAINELEQSFKTNRQ